MKRNEFSNILCFFFFTTFYSLHIEPWCCKDFNLEEAGFRGFSFPSSSLRARVPFHPRTTLHLLCKRHWWYHDATRKFQILICLVIWIFNRISSWNSKWQNILSTLYNTMILVRVTGYKCNCTFPSSERELGNRVLESIQSAWIRNTTGQSFSLFSYFLFFFILTLAQWIYLFFSFFVSRPPSCSS